MFFFLVICLLFSCASEGVQENNPIEDDITNHETNNNHDKITSEKIIAIYYKEKQLEIWDDDSKKKTMDIDEAHLPLGIQKIESIDNNQISFHYANSNKHLIDNIIHVNGSLDGINMDDYTLIIVPSRPNQHGVFEGCLRCPHWTREMALQAKLEWESIFGNFQNIH